MLKLITIFILFVISNKLSSQAPFVGYKSKINVANKSASDSTANVDKFMTELGKPDFFAHANANLVSIQDGKKFFPTINGEIINYKLRVWTREVGDDVKTYIIPFYLISKISGNYIDSSAGPLNDATSVFGAPLTMRLAPSVELFTLKNKYNKLFAGFNLDLRALTIGNTETNNLESGWGAYGSFGLTYIGTGYAFEGDEDTDETKRYEGKWSISTMLYLFKGGGTFNNAIFGNYEPQNLSGFEVLLRFKTLIEKDSKFNFLIGASTGFTENAPNYKKWEFRIGIGK